MPLYLCHIKTYGGVNSVSLVCLSIHPSVYTVTYVCLNIYLYFQSYVSIPLK